MPEVARMVGTFAVPALIWALQDGSQKRPYLLLLFINRFGFVPTLQPRASFFGQKGIRAVRSGQLLAVCVYAFVFRIGLAHVCASLCFPPWAWTLSLIGSQPITCVGNRLERVSNTRNGDWRSGGDHGHRPQTGHGGPR